MGEGLMGRQWCREEMCCLPSNLVLAYEVSKVLKPLFKYTIDRKNKVLGRGESKQRG